MDIADELHTLFKAGRDAFEIMDKQPTYSNLNLIVEELEKLLYTIQFYNEGGKQNLISLIMDKANYTKKYGAPFPRLNCPVIYNKSISDSTTGVIHSKAKAIHHTHITDWDAFEAVEREAQSLII